MDQKGSSIVEKKVCSVKDQKDPIIEDQKRFSTLEEKGSIKEILYKKFLI